MAWSNDCTGYLRDESRRNGTAESIAFPGSEANIIAAIRQVAANGVTCTIQGARTGIVAGAVPDGGYILNLSRMKHIGEIQWDEQAQSHCLTVEPGALLTEIRAVVENAGFFFPPDPTETSASIGGMVASNASGARSYAYGPTRNWIQSLRIVLSNGDVVHLTRGVERVQHGEFTITTENGTVLSGTLPHYPLPQVKNASGYFCTDNMDLLDLFIGMEGTLGIVSDITLRLIPMPQAIHGLTCFFPTEEAALTFVQCIRQFNDAAEASSASPLAAIEFVDHQAVDLVRRTKTENDALSTVPHIRPEYHTAVYIELHGESDEALEQVAMQAMDTLLAVGGNDEDTWYATTARELAFQKAFRHAVPESVNRLIDDRKRLYPALTKLSTDMSVPPTALEQVMAMYRHGLAEAGLESVIFGHIGDNHLHVNILPRDMDDYARGKELYQTWARKVVELGGSVSAEHGIGKLKTAMLQLMYGEQAVDAMQAVKHIFDQGYILNVGNLFAKD